MVGSIDSLDVTPQLPISQERNAIPLDCNQKRICLSKIWIPSNLLPSRKAVSNTRVSKGIFHTLENKDKCIESFSVYPDSDEEDIFLSDSEEDIISMPKQYQENNLSIESSTKRHELSQNVFPLCDNSHEVNTSNFNENGGVLNDNNFQASNQRCNRTDSHISLKDIVDDTDINLGYFRTKDDNFLDKKESKQKKIKKKKEKSIKLGEFLDDYKEADYQNDCCNDYFRKVLREKKQNDNGQFTRFAEFPDLAAKNETLFIHSKEKKKAVACTKTLSEIVNESLQVEESEDCIEETEPVVLEPEVTIGKLVVENIPMAVSKDDIYNFLDGYGEIRYFDLESVGGCFKAYAEIELNSDIDWIIECLNGTEPFGAFCQPLKCYRLP